MLKDREYKLTQEDRITIGKNPNSLFTSIVAEDLIEVIRDNSTSNEIRILCLEIARHGNMAVCLDTALELVESSNDLDLLFYIVLAVRDIGTIEQRILLKAIALGKSQWSSRICGMLCEALYPNAIDAMELITLLDKIEDTPKQGSISIDYTLEQHLKTCVKDHDLIPMVNGMLNLLSQQPRVTIDNKEIPVANRFTWLGETLLLLVSKVLKQRHINRNNEDTIVQVLLVLRYIKQIDSYHDWDNDSVNKALANHPQIRRNFVWNRIRAMQSAGKNNQWGYHWVFRYEDVVKAEPNDIDWLIRDVSELENHEERVIALKLAADCWYKLQRPRDKLAALKKAVSKNKELRRNLGHEIKNPLIFHLLRIWYRLEPYNLKWKFRRLKKYTREKYEHFYDYVWLWCHIGDLRSGKALYTLHNLAIKADQDHHRYSDSNWQALIPEYGNRVAEAAREGWITFWPNFTPQLPHEKHHPNQIDGRVAIGLCGIQIGLHEGLLNINHLSPSNAVIWTAYAVNEMNGFPEWLIELAEIHPRSVQTILYKCVESEWSASAEQTNVYGVLSKLAYGSDSLKWLMAPQVLTLLQQNEPANFLILNYSLMLLIGSDNFILVELAALAAKRTPSVVEENRRLL